MDWNSNDTAMETYKCTYIWVGYCLRHIRLYLSKELGIKIEWFILFKQTYVYSAAERIIQFCDLIDTISGDNVRCVTNTNGRIWIYKHTIPWY